DFSSRMRYFVPKRWLPCDSDSEPIEDQPWFCRITRITFTRSETIVAISCGAIWKVPSPMIATTSESGEAIFAPSEAGSSYPRQGRGGVDDDVLVAHQLVQGAEDLRLCRELLVVRGEAGGHELLPLGAQGAGALDVLGRRAIRGGGRRAVARGGARRRRVVRC